MANDKMEMKKKNRDLPGNDNKNDSSRNSSLQRDDGDAAAGSKPELGGSGYQSWKAGDELAVRGGRLLPSVTKRGESGSRLRPSEAPSRDGSRQSLRAAALSYDMWGGASAPKLLASGKGYVAERILALAEENHIHIHRDSDLVELLMKTDIGEEIPTAAFVAVAEILRYVYVKNAGGKWVRTPASEDGAAESPREETVNAIPEPGFVEC